MAFNLRSLVRIGSAPNADGTKTYSKYLYNDTAAEATVEASGYFNAASATLQVGDQIDATVGIGGTMVRIALIVATNSGGVVTTTSAYAPHA